MFYRAYMAAACGVVLGALWATAGARGSDWPPRGEAIRADVTRDTWVSSQGGEADKNLGHAPRLKLKSNQEFSIVDLDPRQFQGRVITGATFHFVAAQEVQRRMSVSTLASDWIEGTGGSYEYQKGAATYKMAEQDVRPWAFEGSDIMAVCMGGGNTIWRFADCTPPDANKWQTVAVEPRVVAARSAGISHGFVLWDDVGSEYTRKANEFEYHQFPNRFIASKDSNKTTAPYFTVWLGEEDKDPPAAPKDLKSTAEGMPRGQALVTWTTPADKGPAGTLGFVTRCANEAGVTWDRAKPVPQYLVPMAGKPGETARMVLRDVEVAAGTTLYVRAVDGAGNLGPAAQVAVTLSDAPATIEFKPAPVKAFDQVADKPRVGDVQVSVIDALDKVQPVTGTIIPKHDAKYQQANHLWSAADKVIRLYAAKNEFVDFQIFLEGQSPQGVSMELKFDGEAAPAVELLRFRHVNTKAGPMPDPLVPLGGPVTIPAADERIEGQKVATIVADVYVPHGAKAGVHTGTLTLKSGGQSLAIKVQLTVWDFTLPDQLSFMPEMNCYGLPRPPQEVEYYRLAHKHRTVLNCLNYGWSGAVRLAPKWDGKDYAWDEYDQRVGPLLDGSAFADLPRKGVPIEALYLPINENWPINIHEHFKGGYWAESAFDPTYRPQFVDAVGKYTKHLADKKWNQTIFEFYLNNKVYYKAGDKDKPSDWMRSSAPWILDEPAHTQDYWALRWYGVAFHEGATPHRGDVRMAYRCDISRPQWQRDILDGVIDVNVVGGGYRNYLRMILDRKQQNGEILINYGSSNNVEASNVQPAGWCLEAWCLGGDGVLPWQTVGTPNSWKEADQLSIFYPGEAVGSKTPIPSVRLKSYRRGQQDVEYLTLLGMVTSQPRQVIGQTAREALKLAGKMESRGGEDAGTVSYAALSPEALWELRVRVGSMLDAAHPKPQKKLVDFKPVPRDVGKLPDMGYVTVAPPAK